MKIEIINTKKAAMHFHPLRDVVDALLVLKHDEVICISELPSGFVAMPKETLKDELEDLTGCTLDVEYDMPPHFMIRKIDHTDIK